MGEKNKDFWIIHNYEKMDNTDGLVCSAYLRDQKQSDFSRFTDEDFQEWENVCRLCMLVYFDMHTLVSIAKSTRKQIANKKWLKTNVWYRRIGDIKFKKENLQLINLARSYLRDPDRTWTMIIQKQPLRFKWNRLDASDQIRMISYNMIGRVFISCSSKALTIVIRGINFEKKL